MDIGSVLMGLAIVAVLGGVVKVLFFTDKPVPPRNTSGAGSGFGGGGSVEGTVDPKTEEPE